MPTNKPSNFILDSDFATLKNDDSSDVETVTFTGSQVIASNTTKTFTKDITLGTAGAAIRARIASSKDSNKWYSCTTLMYSRTGSPGGYQIQATVTRSSPTTITLIALVLNPYGSSLTTAAGDETFSFKISTFLPPTS